MAIKMTDRAISHGVGAALGMLEGNETKGLTVEEDAL